MDRKTLLKAIDTNRGDVFAPVVAFAGSDVLYVKVNRQYLFDSVKAMPEGETGFRLHVQDGRNFFDPEVEAEEAVTDREIEEKVDLAQAPADDVVDALTDALFVKAKAPVDPIRDVPYASNFDYDKREFKAA